MNVKFSRGTEWDFFKKVDRKNTQFDRGQDAVNGAVIPLKGFKG